MASNSRSNADFLDSNAVNFLEKNARGSLRPLTTWCNTAPAAVPDASVVSSSLALTVGKANYTLSLRAVLSLANAS